MLAFDFRCSHSFIEKALHSVGFSVKLGERVPHDKTLARRTMRVDAAKELLDCQKHHRSIKNHFSVDWQDVMKVDST